MEGQLALHLNHQRGKPPCPRRPARSLSFLFARARHPRDGSEAPRQGAVRQVPRGSLGRGLARRPGARQPQQDLARRRGASGDLPLVKRLPSQAAEAESPAVGRLKRRPQGQRLRGRRTLGPIDPTASFLLPHTWFPCSELGPDAPSWRHCGTSLGWHHGPWRRRVCVFFSLGNSTRHEREAGLRS